jgi:hypothetical protein
VSVTHNNETIKLPPGKTFRVINGTIENVADFNAQTFVDSTRIELYADSIRTSYCKLERQYDIRIKVEGVDTSKLLQEVLLIPTKNCASSSYNSIEIKLQD